MSKYVAQNDEKIIENTVSWIKKKTREDENPQKTKKGLAEKGLLWIKKVTEEKE